MRGIVAGLVVLAFAVSGMPAYALEEWYRWYYKEFAAGFRYQQMGIVTPGINDIYDRNIKDGFVDGNQYITTRFCPDRFVNDTNNDYIFFAARFLPLAKNGGDPDFYALSYLGNAQKVHKGFAFDMMMHGKDIRENMHQPIVHRSQFGLGDSYLAKDGYGDLTYLGSYTPLSFNAGDMDADGEEDFTLGRRLVLSGDRYRLNGQAVLPGHFSTFLRTNGQTYLANLNEGTLTLYTLDQGRAVGMFAMSVEDMRNPEYPLTTIPYGHGGGQALMLRQACGLQVFTLDDGALNPRACIGGLTSHWALPGAVGDFDGDRVPDFWISQTAIGTDPALERDSVTLVSGSRLASARGTVRLKRLALSGIQGSGDYSDHDGISTTLSPIAGDIDNDGRPDLTFTGHRHMNEAGAMYILLGRDLTIGKHYALTDKAIKKVAGPFLAQLAPPYHHWDATDWDDDGHDDIVMTGDNDTCAGYNAGAVYVFSGKKLMEPVAVD